MEGESWKTLLQRKGTRDEKKRSSQPSSHEVEDANTVEKQC